MVHLIILAEGQTEETFVNRTMMPALSPINIYATCYQIRTSRESRGGGLNLDRVSREVSNILRQRSDTYVTTLFDLYGLDSSFPGVTLARSAAPAERSRHIERELARVIVDAVGCRPERFLPHIQPHEFEALLFSDVRRFREEEPEWERFHAQLEDIRASAESPEHINDSPITAPSKRLERLLMPRYKKVRHGASLAERIGLDAIRAACPHFRSWFDRLTTLQPLRPYIAS
jgi:hypothetical protein